MTGKTTLLHVGVTILEVLLLFGNRFVQNNPE
jgi:hypothetical protein